MKKSAWIASIVFAGISLAPVGRHVVADEQPLAGYSVESSRVERQWEEKLRAIPDPDKIRSYMQIMSAHPHHVGSRYDKEMRNGFFRNSKSSDSTRTSKRLTCSF